MDFDAMNEKIDVLLDQIEALPSERRREAQKSLALWRSAKTLEAIGGGPMEARAIYRNAHETLRAMGLETGGMLPPYMGAA